MATTADLDRKYAHSVLEVFAKLHGDHTGSCPLHVAEYRELLAWLKWRINNAWDPPFRPWAAIERAIYALAQQVVMYAQTPVVSQMGNATEAQSPTFPGRDGAVVCPAATCELPAGDHGNAHVDAQGRQWALPWSELIQAGAGEMRGWEAQRAALVAEVGTLKARVAEIERTTVDARIGLACLADGANTRFASFMQAADKLREYREAALERDRLREALNNELAENAMLRRIVDSLASP